jgi:drug/metabolite transporter (DMT)-like permease
MRAMNLDYLFFGFMAVVGAVCGAIVVAVPKAQDFVIAPYFWVLIAMALFDLAIVARRQSRPEVPMLSTPARLLGLIVGVGLMLVVASAGGAPMKFL